MEMTIDEAIEILSQSAVVIGAENWQVARHYAIDTMRKYQKIVGIVSLNDEEFKQCGLKELKEILEVIADGAINSSDCIRP